MELSARSRLRPAAALLCGVVISLVLVGCGSDDAGGAATAATTPITTATTTTTATMVAPAPGTVTVNLSEVTDATNLVMVGVIGKNLPNQPFAAVCEIVTSDPFSFTGAYRPITGGDPCTLGAEPMKLDPGSYEVIVAVMRGGSTSPERCALTDVTVDGDVTVEVTGLGPPGDCNF